MSDFIDRWNSKFGNLNLIAGTNVEASVTIKYTPINRSYEKPYNWYLLVFSPMNDPYISDPEWFQVKGLDRIRSKFHTHETFIITRELDARKTHLNMLICSATDLTKMNGKKCFHKYHINSQVVANNLLDRTRVLAYITKEFQTRSPVKYLDYVIKNPYAQMIPSLA